MPSSSPQAGGMPIALGAIGGAGVGLAFGQSSLGFLIGTGAGAALALLIWWRGRR